MDRLFLALHYLRRHRIMWVSVLGVMVGLSAIVLVDSIFNGFIQEYLRITKGVRSDLSVRLLPAKADGVPADPEEVERALGRLPLVAGVARRVLQPCLFPTDKELPPSLGIGQMTKGPVLDACGVDYEDEASVSDLRRFLANAEERVRVRDLDHPFAWERPGGDGLSVPGPIPVLLGFNLVRHLGLEIGDLVTLLTVAQVSQGGKSSIEPVQAEFRFVGAVASGQYQTDLHVAWMRIEDLQSFARLAGSAQEYAVRLKGGDGLSESQLEDARDTVQAALFGLGPVSVATWLDGARGVRDAVENQRQILDVILFFIVLVAGFTLLVTLSMTITRKRLDIGLLSSLGATARGVAGTFTSLGVLVFVVGATLGVVLGSVMSTYVDDLHQWFTKLSGEELFRESVYGFREIPHALDVSRVLLYVGLGFFSTLVFSALASFRVARMDPVEALRRH